MRILFVPIALALLGTTVRANDEKESRYYLQWTLGGVFSETAEDVTGAPVDFDPGFSSSLILGRRLPLGARTDLGIEGEVYYQYFTADEDDVVNIPSATDDDAGALAFMLNGIIDWEFTPQYSIYGGVGVGWARGIEYKPWDAGSLSMPDDDAVAFQAKFGFDWDLGGNYDVLLGYRYFRTDALDIEGGISGEEIDLGQHVIEAGFRWGL